MPALVLSLFISAASGFFLTCVLWPPGRGVRGALALRAVLSVGLGLGVSSCISFICLVLAGPSVMVLLSVELGVLVCLAVVFGYAFLTSQESSAGAVGPSPQSASRTKAILLVGVLVLVVLGVVSFSWMALMKPHGDWDAYVSWNLRARFLFRGGAEWQRAFSPLVPRSCPGYPVFLPALVARCWHYVGTDVVAAPVGVAALFTFGVVALGFAALRALRDTVQGLLAAAVLLGTPYLLMHGTSQYSDVPMAFFLLGTAVLLTLANRFAESRRGLLVLAGFMCGLAVTTKHEGMLFVLGLTVVAVVWLIRSRDRKSCLTRIGAFAAGLALPLLLFIYLKTALAPKANYMVAGMRTPDVLRRLGDLSRYGYIAKSFLEQIFNVSRWCALPLVLVFYLLLAGTRTDSRDRPGIRTAAYVLAVMVLGQFIVYLITTDKIEWHVTYSIDRFLLQLWPTAVFVILLAARTPAEAASATRPTAD